MRSDGAQRRLRLESCVDCRGGNRNGCRSAEVPRGHRRTVALVYGLAAAVATIGAGSWLQPQSALLLDRAPVAARLKAPAELQIELPVPRRARHLVNSSREQIVKVLDGYDDRLIAIVGPCSVHDVVAVREYAGRLRRVAIELEKDLFVVMRTYLEKPRTSVGWRGLVSDPDLSGAEDFPRGLGLGRRVLLDVAAAGLPSATEFLDPLVAPFFADLVSYGSIGARTVESPTHRALAAALPIPLGFKNGRSGDVQSAVNAVVAASHPQRRLAIDASGRLQVLDAPGNLWGHVVLRGSENGPNYNASFVADAAQRLLRAGFSGRRVVVDCSHGNSGKKYEGQLASCEVVASQVAAGSGSIAGVMIESFLEAGHQPLDPGHTNKSELKYGQSVTDACLDFPATEALLFSLASAARARRERSFVTNYREVMAAGTSETTKKSEATD